MPLPPLVADEDFNNDIIRALKQQQPDIDIVRVIDIGLGRAKDPLILEWAASQNRILLTHDVNTMTRYANERFEAGIFMAGMIQVRRGASIRRIVEDILACLEACTLEELSTAIYFVPFPMPEG